MSGPGQQLTFHAGSMLLARDDVIE